MSGIEERVWLTDEQIYKKCETKEGFLDFLREEIESYNGYMNWIYFDGSKIPIINDLLDEGIIVKKPCKAVRDGYEYTFKELSSDA